MNKNLTKNINKNIKNYAKLKANNMKLDSSLMKTFLKYMIIDESCNYCSAASLMYNHMYNMLDNMSDDNMISLPQAMQIFDELSHVIHSINDMYYYDDKSIATNYIEACGVLNNVYDDDKLYEYEYEQIEFYID